MLKKTIFLFFLYIWFLNNIHASPVDAPQPRCVSVLPNGDITIAWSIPADPSGTFDSYHIYSSASPGGPYTQIDSVFTYTQTSYTHVGANGNTGSVYYYFRTRSEVVNVLLYSSESDTVNSMKLNIANPGNGLAMLSWNAIAVPNIISSTGIYKIYREYPLGNWLLKGTSTNTNYTDTIDVCNAFVNYKVEISDSIGCISVSSDSAGIFQNIIVPSVPVFDTLSVDDNNKALMSWSINTASDMEAYVIYHFNGTSWIPIDTVPGINNVVFNYLLSGADQGSEEYRLAAFDTCGNISPLSSVCSTIFLSSAANVCDRSVTLNWTAYSQIGTGLAGYRIYQSVVNLTGPYTLLGTVSAGTLTYTVPGLSSGTTYYYKIEAFDLSGSKTTSSNRITFYSATPLPADFMYLRKASVIEPNKIEITCLVDVTASVSSYKVLRSTVSSTDGFDVIATVPAGSVNPFIYEDFDVSTNEKRYYYKIVGVDSCGFDDAATNIGHTILLTASGNSETMMNTLKWNDYREWLGSVSYYNIYRGIDGIFDVDPFTSVPYTGAGENTFLDDITTETEGQGIFDYYIEAIEGAGNAFGYTDTSKSNIARAYQEDLIFIPNAFSPNGNNNVFIPAITYISFTGYEFLIFDRWGQTVFSTNDVKQGWDGAKAQAGVYIYLIRYKTPKGESRERKGSVTLLK